jgi:hypothetical protein
VSEETQGDLDNRVTLVYPTGETEQFEIESVRYNGEGELERVTMILIPIEETDDEPQGDSRTVSEGQ